MSVDGPWTPFPQQYPIAENCSNKEDWSKNEPWAENGHIFGLGLFSRFGWLGTKVGAVLYKYFITQNQIAVIIMQYNKLTSFFISGLFQSGFKSVYIFFFTCSVLQFSIFFAGWFTYRWHAMWQNYTQSTDNTSKPWSLDVDVVTFAHGSNGWSWNWMNMWLI